MKRYRRHRFLRSLLNFLRYEYLWALLVFGLSVSLFFYKVTFQKQVILATDYDQEESASAYQKTFATQFYEVAPVTKLSWDTVRRGQVPLWNPYVLTGVPLLADSQNGVLEFSKLVLYRLGSVFDDFWNQLVLSRFLLAGFFMYLFLRRLGVSRLAGFFGSTAWMFSAPLIAWAGHPIQAGWIWFPFLLWCLESLIRTQRHKYGVLWSAGVAALCLSGSMETGVQIFFLLVWVLFFRFAGLVLERYVVRDILKLYRRIFLFTLIGLLLAAPQIIPWGELVFQGGRIASFGSPASEMPRTIWDYLSRALLLVSPTSAGEQKQGVWILTGSSFATAGIYAGLSTVVLAIMGWMGYRRRKYTWFAVVTGALCFVLSLGLPAIRSLRSWPLLDALYSDHLRLLVVWALVLLSSLGFDYLLSFAQKRRRYLGLFLVIFLWIDLFVSHSNFIPFGVRGQTLGKSGQIDTLREYNPTRARILSFSSYLPPNTSILYRLFDVRGRAGMIPRRVQSVLSPWLSEDEAWIAERVPDNWLDLLSVRFLFAESLQDFFDAGGPALSRAGQEERGYSLLSTTPRVLIENENALGRAFIVDKIQRYGTQAGVVERMKSSLFDPAREALVEDRSDSPLLQRLEQRALEASRSPEPKNTMYLPERVEYSVVSDQDAFFVFTDSWYPGWQSYLDGKQVETYMTDGAFRGLYMPAGKHEVSFRFHSFAFQSGLWIALTACLWLLWLSLPSLRRYSREGLVLFRGIWYDLRHL